MTAADGRMGDKIEYAANTGFDRLWFILRLSGLWEELGC